MRKNKIQRSPRSIKIRHIIRNIIFVVLGIGALAVAAVIIWVASIQLPDFSNPDTIRLADSTKIYDRTGKIVLYDLGSDAHRTSISYDDIGSNIENAVVAIEDASFYQNHGIEIKSIVRAVFADLTGIGPQQGGSTITQQLIKKSLLSDDKSLIRKMKEVILALKLERSYSKEQILQTYLNIIPYGGNIYGIQEASQAYLGKNPKDLDLAESAYLAAIPNAPTHYSPYGSHVDDLEARKNLVLSRELKVGFITQDQYASAKAEKVTFLPQQSQGIKAPHFDFFIKDYLEQKYGTDEVETGGLKVITTIDYDLQQAAEKAVAEYTTGDKKSFAKQNAGLVAIDPKTGQILAMVGSRDYFDKEIDGNFNVATAMRQPGSSFKPYMYVTAFEKGYTPETVLFDVPTEFSSACNPYGQPYPGHVTTDCYMPQDYDGKTRGPISIRDALARSLNIPAVKMLYMVGVKNAIKTAQDMGITTLTDPASRYGLTLVLGGGEVKLLDMTSAYGVFATEGVRHPDTGILSVTDKTGATLEEFKDAPLQVLPQNPTLQISDVLSDNVARTPTFGANSALYFPDRQVAVKTGTTNDFKDSWTMGYTPSLVAGVWMGKNDNTSMPAGVTSAAMWHMFMAEALKKYPVETFPQPDVDPDYGSLHPVMRGVWQGNETYTIDTTSGQLATDQTPPQDRKEIAVTNVHDILHWVNKDDPTGPSPSNPGNDPLYNNWETAVQNWWSTHSGEYAITTSASIPSGYDMVHTAENAPTITITNPADGSSFPNYNPISVVISETGKFALSKIDVFLNNTFVGTANSNTYTFSPAQTSAAKVGTNSLKVIGTDVVGNTDTKTISIDLTN